MPELPDIVAYIEALRPRVERQRIERVRVISPFVVRSVEPPIEAVEGTRVNGVRRLGKRLVFALDDELFLVLHLMIAGRLRWEPPLRTLAAHSRPGRNWLATFEFDTGMLLLTEAGSKKRASLHMVAGERALGGHDPGGIEVLEADAETFLQTLRRENHTLKRALTDPRLFSGIGNAYSDEILHAARLSPLAWTSRLSDEEARRLFTATQDTLTYWIAELRRQFAGRFPEPGEITAFRNDFAVHGRFGKPCPVCGSPVQRIRYAENETNYCATCQTGGRVLADRSLSRILKDDWPRSIDELA